MATTTRPHSSRPKLAQLKTPLTSTFPSNTFPSELSALSARTPLSAFPAFHNIKMEEGVKTPITPPSAYTEFLKNIQSPAVSEMPYPPPFSRNNCDASTASGGTVESISSNSSGSMSEDSDRSISPRSILSETITPLSSASSSITANTPSIKSPSPTSLPHPTRPQFAFPRPPQSAPLNSTGRMRLRIPTPASPASIYELTSPLSAAGTPLSAHPFSVAYPMSASCTSACTSAIRSPFSARLDSHPHFDWEAVVAGGPKSAAASARYFDVKTGSGSVSAKGCGIGGTIGSRVSKSGVSGVGVRHVREVVTRTVTYSATPRVGPVPRGKRRRVGGVAEKMKREGGGGEGN